MNWNTDVNKLIVSKKADHHVLSGLPIDAKDGAIAVKVLKYNIADEDKDKETAFTSTLLFADPSQDTASEKAWCTKVQTGVKQTLEFIKVEEEGDAWWNVRFPDDDGSDNIKLAGEYAWAWCQDSGDISAAELQAAVEAANGNPYYVNVTQNATGHTHKAVPVAGDILRWPDGAEKHIVEYAKIEWTPIVTTLNKVATTPINAEVKEGIKPTFTTDYLDSIGGKDDADNKVYVVLASGKKYLEVVQSYLHSNVYIEMPEGGTPHLYEVTTEELLDLMKNEGLEPGASYRVTDYEFKAPAGCSSGGHSFDIVVRAMGKSHVNNVAMAALHEGDTYFKAQDISQWELKVNVSTGEGGTGTVEGADGTMYNYYGDSLVVDGTTYHKIVCEEDPSDPWDTFVQGDIEPGALIGDLSTVMMEENDDDPFPIDSVVSPTEVMASNWQGSKLYRLVSSNPFNIDGDNYYLWMSTYNFNDYFFTKTATPSTTMEQYYGNRVQISAMNFQITSVNGSTIGISCFAEHSMPHETMCTREAASDEIINGVHYYAFNDGDDTYYYSTTATPAVGDLVIEIGPLFDDWDTVENADIVASESGISIVHMKDSYDNEAPYDFKNLMMPAGPLEVEDYQFINAGADATFLNVYTFANLNDFTDNSLNGIASGNVIKGNSFKFNIITGKNNEIGAGSNYCTIMGSNNSVGANTETACIAEGTSYNVIGNNCNGIYILPNGRSNTVGDNGSEVYICDNCHDNVIGNNAGTAIGISDTGRDKPFTGRVFIDENSHNNKLGNYCVVTLGKKSKFNEFSNNCAGILGQKSDSNIIEHAIGFNIEYMASSTLKNIDGSYEGEYNDVVVIGGQMVNSTIDGSYSVTARSVYHSTISSKASVSVNDMFDSTIGTEVQICALNYNKSGLADKDKIESYGTIDEYGRLMYDVDTEMSEVPYDYDVYSNVFGSINGWNVSKATGDNTRRVYVVPKYASTRKNITIDGLRGTALKSGELGSSEYIFIDDDNASSIRIGQASNGKLYQYCIEDLIERLTEQLP